MEGEPVRARASRLGDHGGGAAGAASSRSGTPAPNTLANARQPNVISGTGRPSGSGTATAGTRPSSPSGAPSTTLPRIDGPAADSGDRRPWLARVGGASWRVAVATTVIGVAAAVLGGSAAFNTVYSIVAEIVGLVVLALIPLTVVSPWLGRRSSRFLTLMVIGPAIVAGGFFGLVVLNLIARNAGWLQPT
jgi:hypothetical protein